MRYPDTKIEAVCGTDARRGAIQQPWLDVDNKRMIATNGHVLAVLPVLPCVDDVTGTVPVDAIKAARAKGAECGGDSGECYLSANSDVSTANGARFQRPDETFVDYEKVIPKKPQNDPDIILDAALLKRLSDALHNRKGGKDCRLAFWFSKTDRGAVDSGGSVRVQPPHDDERVGVIMPCRK